MKFSAKELILKRKSVRTYDGRGIREEDLRKLEEYLQSPDNPFGVPVEFRLLDKKEFGLSSPVILGEEIYLAAKVRKTVNFEIAYGYSFEKACLYALSLGLGTVMLAASLSRSAFEKAMEVKEGEVMPAASPVGYPAKKRSIRENLMRKGLKADERLPFEDTFFSGSFERGLKKEEAGEYKEALAMAALAPSAGNKQPWRAVADKDRVHFYEHRSLKESPLGDIQKVDVGIFLCHFETVLKEQGIKGAFVSCDPGIALPSDTRYIISFERRN